MLMMDDETLIELRALRARAYGPDADIDADPAARARLAELESSARAAASAPEPARPTPTDGPGRHDASATDAAPAPDGAAEPAAGPEADAGPEPDAAPEPPPVPVRERLARAWRRRPVAIAWTGSLVVVAAVVAAATYGVAAVRPISPATGATQIATLDDGDESDAAWLDGWWGAGSAATAYDFHGLIVIHSPVGVFTNGTDCLTVVPAGAVSQDGTTIEGQMYYGCAAGAFPAVAQFTISETSPDELQEAFGLGTSLQFVLAPEGVGVFADPPRPTPSVSASIVAG